MPKPSPYIVCFGRDPMLLETRRMLLVRAGYQIHATSDEFTVTAALESGAVSVLILCHSLSGPDTAKIVKFHEDIHSPAPVLYLALGDRSPAPVCAAVLDAYKGPAAFIATVRMLNGSAQASA